MLLNPSAITMLANHERRLCHMLLKTPKDVLVLINLFWYSLAKDDPDTRERQAFLSKKPSHDTDMSSSWLQKQENQL